MSMSKKDFIALGSAVRNAPVPFLDAQVKTLADFCASQNPRFNRERWLEFVAGKCGPNGGEIKNAGSR